MGFAHALKYLRAGISKALFAGGGSGGAPEPRRSEALGSGFVISQDGLIVTNWGNSIAPTVVLRLLAELIDPVSGETVPWREGATGELVYTALGRQASPVLRFRSGDHITVTAMGGPGGRTTPAIRCFGRTDDMLIVRGINLFPSAIQDLVSAMKPLVGGVVRVVADFEGHTTQDNLKLLVERAPGVTPDTDTAAVQQVETRVRNALSVKVEVRMVRHGFFDAPGAQKVSLTLRKMPDLSGA